MSDWALIIYCGLITFLTRFSMIALLKKEMFNDRIREILSYVPSAIFPAIIFPAIFLDNIGSIEIEDNPKNPQYILNARGKGWQIRGRALNN